MIELAPKEFHIFCTFDEAILYCFQLNIDGKTGWRLPTHDEYMADIDAEYSCWYSTDYGLYDDSALYECFPVRDI